MKEFTFGDLIAFVAPGFLGVWALAHVDPVAAGWIGTVAMKETSVGAFLFVTMASVGVGVFLSGARWLLYEQTGLIHLLGVPERKDLDQQKKAQSNDAYRDLVEAHYKFYLFYGNTSIALLLAAVLTWQTITWQALLLGCGAEAVLVTAAGESLKRLRSKTLRLLGEYEPPERKLIA